MTKNRAKTSFANSFATTLSSIELDSVFNPYRHVCSDHDDEQSPRIRLQNLITYIDAARTAELSTVWIGRDLGYRGGRRTGLPLTDEEHLSTFKDVFSAPARKATRTENVKERTAAEIWRILSIIPSPPFLWNAFPFHPHEEGNHLNNRCHTKREFSICEDLLVSLLEEFNFENIYVLGNDAERAMTRLGKKCTYVRHPSYGGQTEFRRHMTEAYHLQQFQFQKQPELAL